MFFSRGFSRIPRSSFNGFCRFFFSHRPEYAYTNNPKFLPHSTRTVLGCREDFSAGLLALHGYKHQIHQQSIDQKGKKIHHQSSAIVEDDQLDPFSLVAEELSLVANRLRSMIVVEVPKLASAAEYFFKMGVEGKRFRPTVLLLMSTALNVAIHEPPKGLGDTVTPELRTRQQLIAQVTEMIHVASLLHDDVLDDADTRRGIGSLNVVMGNKVSVLAGDFLLSRACVVLASLKNTEVVTLLANVLEDLVKGETLQMTMSSDQRCSMEYYMEKTYRKTASLISNSCKAIAILAGQTAKVATLASEYGKNLGLAYQLIDDLLDFTGTSASLGKGSLSDIRHGIVTAPILFAIEEFPQLRTVVEQGFDNPTNVDLALEYLGKSRGIQKTRELAMMHANLAAEAIDSMPESDDIDVKRSRRALVDLTQRVITRTK
ncbi:solanesyl diphosphate synthase 3, chloroplastic/mitochondrial [Ziziphus jujuba]|uniref:Solanesyl diphosphate synthase 3, chloroplastic/mitochondrial n=1 Tax=Ziziphus jujuba TaxID=326968 RepID=A0A6P3YVN5_ZIZJJ|nr:solanesyl diphosphate synthase 3, chloroplastic/mitochondrial [Ziziphus jujuba]